MNKNASLNRLNFGKRVAPTTAADIEYFCKGCKGHYSRVVSLESFWRTTCRCGSADLLIYSMSGEISAPLRAN